MVVTSIDGNGARSCSRVWLGVGGVGGRACSTMCLINKATLRSQPGAGSCTCRTSTWEAETGELLPVGGEPVLYSKSFMSSSAALSWS